MFKPGKLGFILNPMAGRKKVEHWEDGIRHALSHRSVEWEILRTKEPREAMQLSSELSKSMDLVVAVGGDGTVHEVAQGVIGTNAVLGLLPSGSGNDFNRFLNMPRDITKGVIALMDRCKILQVDAAKLMYSEEVNLAQMERWFINTAGFGFDAAVAFTRDRIPLLKGFPLYLTSALVTLAKYGSHRFSSVIDNGDRNDFQGLMVCAGIGKYEGGGFKVLPEAIHDDGKIDVCHVKSLNKLIALPLLTKAVVGLHTGSSNVIMARGERLVLESVDPFAIHVDGEVLTSKAVRAEAIVSTKALKVAVLPSVV